jgi:tetratricopeptide (TPR) repeat protein
MKRILSTAVGCIFFSLSTSAGSVDAQGRSSPVLDGCGALKIGDVKGLPRNVRTTLESASREVAAKPQDASAVGRLAMLLHAYQQHRAAAPCYAVASRLDAAAAAWPYLSGIVLTELGDHGPAVEEFRRALQRDPDSVAARIRLADALMQVRDLDASQKEYSALARDLPELALAQYGLGRIASLRGDSKAAVEAYRRAVELVPQFGPAHYALALAYRDLGLGDRAAPHLDAFRRFETRRPSVGDLLMDRVRALRETARDLLAQAATLGEAGRLDEAIAVHLEALKLDPHSAQAHVNLISLYGRAGRPAEARSHYAAALRLEGSAADAHYNYGVLLASARQDEAALAAFLKALDVDPFHAAAPNNAAALLARARRYAEASAHYRQALSNDPQHQTARVNLGRVLVLLGKPQEAMEQFKLALDRAERRGDAAGAAAIRAELRKVTGKQ